MLSKEEIENKIKPIGERLQDKINRLSEENFRQSQYIEQLESEKQNLIEKLEERMKSVEKCYQDLIKPYYDERLNMINVSFMSRKEKEEFTNKRN